MGVVYVARDERLQRSVALKTMASLARDETARQRFWREARAAASVNHPNICQIYEIGEDGGDLFIAMELLEGESLSDRVRQGPLTVSKAMPIALGMLSALSALHQRGIVHRDLKPSNVFLTPHGVKVLDFGLARPNVEASLGQKDDARERPTLTQTGLVMGTPRYMAPEQITGDPVDARTDLFSVGAIVYEMLTGKPPFGGRSVIEVLHATVSEQPAALSGSPAVAAVDRVIRRALAKRPGDRPQSADELAESLRAIRGVDTDDTPALAHALTRLVVLPFRVLRPDPETDFLAFSLPDAISTSLSGIGSLVVRSSATASQFKGETPDLNAVASQADVDRVVMGTLLRSGAQLRIVAQLVDAPSGTLLASHTFQSSLGDLFQLQDDIAKRIVEALALPLRGSAAPPPEAPKNSIAYELYLRGNELARTYERLTQARATYERCLALDPKFAPAWAQIGRCHRVIGKFIEGSHDSEECAEEAFRRALGINPRLTLAHKFYAYLEADMGHATRAMVRLLDEANRHGNDAELFAGISHTCRYCGLYEQAIAADGEARRLDPNAATNLEQTLLLAGDLERLLTLPTPPTAGGDAVIRVIGLGLAGRRDEARQWLVGLRQAVELPTFQWWYDYLMAWLDRRPADMSSGLAALTQLTLQNDPEAIFLEGWLHCDIGEHAAGLAHLTRAVAKGYFVAPTLSAASQFDALRGDPAFHALLSQAEKGRARALEAFRDAGGERLLGA
jgi:non-specific serine/threonine protein kinase